MIILLLNVAESRFLTNDEVSTICVLLTTIIMLIYQFKLCIPFNKIRAAMFISLSTLFIIEVLFFRNFFMLSELNGELIFLTILLLTLGVLMWYFYNRMLKFMKKYAKKYIKRV
jgi:cation-transporting ATPase E